MVSSVRRTRNAFSRTMSSKRFSEEVNITSNSTDGEIIYPAQKVLGLDSLTEDCWLSKKLKLYYGDDEGRAE